ncbi:MAG: MBL fold metallo-hydrolase [Deltaproteobacteria bacterium]|nr:MBL fold metallo-hydrolase [Deltaproteobacteria bacterium]
MAKDRYDDAVAVTHEISWVGFYEEETKLHCNPYVLLDEEEAVFIDPGSIPDFPVIMRKVIEVVRPAEISLIVASHQDPDVCGNLPVVEDVIDRPDLRIAAHMNTVRLIRHYGLRSELYPVDRNNYTLTLKSGRRLDFFWTPFLHSPGAIMTFDGTSGTLFTSDLFGGLSEEWALFAKGDFLTPMAAFHRLYMPTRELLARCMDQVAELPVQRICPQHGSILQGSQVKEAIAFLKALPCAMDAT